MQHYYSKLIAQGVITLTTCGYTIDKMTREYRHTSVVLYLSSYFLIFIFF